MITVVDVNEKTLYSNKIIVFVYCIEYVHCITQHTGGSSRAEMCIEFISTFCKRLYRYNDLLKM